MEWNFFYSFSVVAKFFTLSLTLSTPSLMLHILHKRYNWQSYNFEKYGLPVETPPKGKLLLYPIQVIWLFCSDNLLIWSSFPPGEYRGRAYQPGDVWDIPWLQRDCQGSGRKNWSDSWEINNLTFRDLSELIMQLVLIMLCRELINLSQFYLAWNLQGWCAILLCWKYTDEGIFSYFYFRSM